VSFAAITICVASQLVFIVVNIYFVTDSVQKLLNILPYLSSLTSCELLHLLMVTYLKC